MWMATRWDEEDEVSEELKEKAKIKDEKKDEEKKTLKEFLNFGWQFLRMMICLVIWFRNMIMSLYRGTWKILKSRFEMLASLWDLPYNFTLSLPVSSWAQSLGCSSALGPKHCLQRAGQPEALLLLSPQVRYHFCSTNCPKRYLPGVHRNHRIVWNRILLISIWAQSWGCPITLGPKTALREMISQEPSRS